VAAVDALAAEISRLAAKDVLLDRFKIEQGHEVL
jgi:hypothetical protein